MASGSPKKTWTPRLLSRERLKSVTLLSSAFKKFFSRKSPASTEGSFLPKIQSLLGKTETGQKMPSVTKKQSLLQVFPPEIVFQNFDAHEVSEMVLSLINKDKFPRLVKISMERSPYFELLCPNDAYRVIPPGASSIVRIRFTPYENKNYSHQLICIIGLQKIVVPIRAIGARAVLEFPDHLDFLECPVKYSTQKTVLVRNVGNLEAHFQLSTQRPFFVVPARGTLGEGDTMQVTVGFHPLTTGDHSGSLEVRYNTGGKSIDINLQGEAVDVPIELSTNYVKFEKTFITMSNYTTVFIENRSNITAHFQWKTFPIEEEENDEKKRQCFFLQPWNEEWLENFMEEKKIAQEKGFCEDNTALLSHMVQEVAAKVQEDPMLYSNDIFLIEPMEGEIEPNQCAEIKVTFKPLEVQEYQSVAYCNISGRENRLPLRLRGEGQGPLVKLSNDTLNLGEVLVDTLYVYKVELINKGALDAPFNYIPSTTMMGSCFKFAPEEGIIAAGGIQTIRISFKVMSRGCFEEEFRFRVSGSPKPLTLTISGCMCGATVYFEMEELNFGDISFGFPYTMTCRLINGSPGFLKFKLRMSDDGIQPAVTSFDQIGKPDDPAWEDGIHFYVEPREFTVNPSQGTIIPQGYQDIEVTLCSNTVMEFYRRLLVDLEGIGNEMATLIISARCLVPELRVYPHVLLYDECCLKVPYERKFLVVNNTDLPGCYGLIPQKREEDTPVFYSSPKPCGIVQPHSTAEIPVVIEVQTLGEHRTCGLVGVFGDERNPRSITIRSTGKLAKVFALPNAIEFGKIPVLQPKSQIFTLFNEGLSPVGFRIEVAHKRHCYAFDITEGEIPAQGEIPVTITATLDDTEYYSDSIQLFFCDNRVISIPIWAIGIGTTIVIDKPFSPVLNLGYQFSFLPCVRQFKLTNGGCHFRELFWSVECCSPADEGQSVSALPGPETEDHSQSPKRTSPVFELQPPTMELQPGESADLVLQGFSRIAQVVQDYVVCGALIGKPNWRKKIMETIITCEFIDPSIEVSARQFSFRVEKKPSDVLTLQYQLLAVKNTCSLPLDLLLDVEQPFLVCDVDQQPLPDGQPVTLDVGQSCHLYIAFDPAYKKDFYSWKDKKVLKINMVRGHPYEEHITLLGEVHYPNLQIVPSILDFGCIVAGTEELRSVQMTNCSPLPVKYQWSFHSDSQVNKLRHELYPPKFQPRPPVVKRTCLPASSQWRRFKTTNTEKTTSPVTESWDLAQSLEEVPSEGHPPLEMEELYLFPDVPYPPLKVEKAFSILPHSGVLQPGESQKVTFTFSGQLDTVASAIALCQVEGGPTYQVMVAGEASRISYALSQQEITCGHQMFNEVHHTSVILVNTGKIKFNWVLSPSVTEQHLPGVFVVEPTQGTIGRGEKEVLKFSYLPGVPGTFSRTFLLKVGDLEPECICLRGGASFPMIAVNLPWNAKENESYEKPLKHHVKPLQRHGQKNEPLAQKKAQSSKTTKTQTSKSQNPKTQTSKSQNPKTQTSKSQNPKTQTSKSQNPKTQTLKTQTLKTQAPKTQALKTPRQNPQLLGSGIIPNIQLQLETVMKLVKKRALELQKRLPSFHPHSLFPEKELCQTLVKVELPEYVLDMGTVIKGYTKTHTLAIANPGQIPVSFQVDVSALQNTGFRVDLDQVQGLAHSQTKTLEVCFESAHRDEGNMDVLLPIEVTKGPTYNIRLRATVLELSLDLSKNTLEFSDTLVGQCQIETVRLYNRFQVPCKWFIHAVDPVTKDDQHQYWTPGQKQRALEDEPCPFAVTPSKGTLDAGKWQNLQVQFTPKKERSYKNELKLSICGSRHHLKLHLSGQGLEPRLEFNPPALKMGWVLVNSNGLEATLVVKNPCSFPVEFYSLDFDEQYLEEEKILRMAVGSEYQKNFLMPPRAVGGTLPPEVLENYEAQKSQKAQKAELKAMAEATAMSEAEAMDKAAPAYDRAVTSSSEPMVEVTGNPVSWAVMRYLGIDPSSERREAQQDRRIVLIIHGPPRAGKTEVAAALCHYYDTAHLSIDTVVKEAIANDQSQAGCQARELCTKAAMELKAEDEDRNSQLSAQSKNKQASGEKNNKKNAKVKIPSAQKKKEPVSKADKKFTVSTAPAPQQLNITSSNGEELNCLSCVLPEDLLVDILCERLKREDCFKGVVFDGLESLFTSSLESSMLCLLKAVKNCHHIYMVNLHQDWASWVTKEEDERKKRKAKREKEELQRKKAFQRNIEHVLKMDEDEYCALPEKKKTLMDKIIQGRKHLRREMERKQLAQKLEEEAKALEEEERQKEEERRKEEEKWKKEKKGKQSAKPEKKETKSPEKETQIPGKKEIKSPEKKETKPSDKRENRSPEKKENKSPGRKETKSPEKKETKAPEKGEPKDLEDEINKILEDEITEILEEETKILEECKYKAKKISEITDKEETESPDKEETESPEKEETESPEKEETESPEKEETESPEKEETESPEKEETESPEKGERKSPEKGERKSPEKGERKSPEKGEPKPPMKGDTRAPGKGETKAPDKGEAEISEYPAEMDKNLIQRFQIYDSSQQDVAQVFTYFDRVQGTVQLPVIQNGNTSQLSSENKSQRTSKPQEKVEKKPEQKSGGWRSLQSSQLETQSEVAEGAIRDEHVGMPCLDIQVTNPKAMIREILKDGRLPTKDEMLRYLGLHPEGPPLPPAAVFSIVDYPEERLGSAERVKPFTIAAPEGAAMEHNLAKTPDVQGSSAEGQPKTGKAASRYSSPMENQISTQRTESPQDSFVTRSKSVLKGASIPTEFLRLKRYRWIVPSHGEVELNVHFSTKKPGQFEQTLRFELVESKRQYELPCSGTGLYPSISQNPRLVFPQWRETMEADEIIFKEYVESTKQFHLGPLLCGKSRDWYKSQNHRGNSENLTILNNSPMDIEVQFSFEIDGEADTFFLDPPSMTLKPKEKQELTIWAFPTSPGFVEDRLICCIEKNPEPVVFSLCCHGVQVKLEISPLVLSFDKLLLHGTDSRTLVLRNDNLLPMAWQFSGLDDLVEAFSLSQDNGTIDPRSEFEVTLSFKAEKIGLIGKILRLEVSDTENVLGIVQAENIEISAEVYDVALNIDMPEGPDGSLEFGTINVLDNVKKVLTLKNKGIYNIGYRFILKGAGPRTQDVASHFTVEPQSGTLIASQPGTNVEMLFHPKREMLLKNRLILYCQVMDARSGKVGQTVATIPVRVSAKAVYSKYSIEPASPIDFGAMIKTTRKTQIVVLENKGMLNFKFRIQQAPKDSSASLKPGESAVSSIKVKSSFPQDHLTVGMFTVSPCSGSIAPWGQQKITVDCLAGQEGICEEQLYIDITGRDPRDNPLGIPFILTAESCLPGIIEDAMLIFEEYPICSSTNLVRKLRSVKGAGLFVRDENKFVFTKVLVGQEAEANFSIYNASGMPCDMVLFLKPPPGKEKIPINDIFKLYPLKMSIPGSSKAIATVTFTPPDQQTYECIFKASLVIPKSPVKIRPQTLSFTISGKGYEPQVAVVCPSAHSKRGNAVLRFKRLQVEDSEMLPLVICNKGITHVKFMLNLEDEHGAFSLKSRPSTLDDFHTEDVEEFCIGNESKPPNKPYLLLRRGRSTEFDVTFKPTLAQRLEGKIHVLVGDLYVHNIVIELVGEGHKDEFTLDGLEEDTEERNAESSLKKDIIDAVRVNHIQFGECPVGKPCHRTFTITNHTHKQAMRFQWKADSTFQFSPKVGHLLPGCAKDITVTLKSDVPAVFRRHLVKCKVARINFELPQRKVQDWDDRMSIVTWKDTTRTDPAASWPEKEKVVKPAPEPAYTVEEESIQEAEVYLSAFVAYSQFKLSTVVVQLKDTAPNQTRTATFRMCNTGKVALKYTWVEAADSEAVEKPYFTTLMRQFLSSATLRHRKKLLRDFWWQQDHPFETHPSELRQQRQLAKQQWRQQQHSEQQQQQPSEEEQLDSKQKQHSKKQHSSKEQHLSQQQQQQPEQQGEQPEQQEEQSKEQQPEQQDHAKKLLCSKQKHLSLQRVCSSQEIFPDVIHDLPLFSIDPYQGIIASGQKQIFNVLFSPKCMGKFETTMLCRIPNLKPSLKKARVIVKGRAWERKSFDKPKRSALRQTEKGQGPRKRVHWKPTPE